MTNVRGEIVKLLKQALKDLGISEIEPQVEYPKDESHGDYSTNVAMIAFGKVTKGFETPIALAKKIASSVERLALSSFEKVEAVKPGFINFWISKEYLIDQLNLVSKTPLRSSSFAGRRIIVEFTDPNPFKEFHIGHLYSNTVGESISRLLEAMGAQVKRANYQGDVGMHVAKALYGLLPTSNFKLQNSKLDEKSLKEKIKILGEAYAFGTKVYEEDEGAKREIEELNKKIYGKDEAIMALYEKGRQWSLEYFETIYKRLGTKFDFYYFESEVGITGLELVKKYWKKGIFEKSQGAVIFPGEKHGLHNRVFINSLGLPTYEAKELGLALRKYEDFKFDQSIVVTGNEIIGYFKVLLAALSKIRPDLADKTKHLSHGMVRLPTGKMSSRTGNVLTGEWLLDEAKKLLKSQYPEMEDDTLEKVAVGSVKYALLKSSLGHDIEFNFEESISIQGNSGPYLQYAYARTQSVLAKSEKRKAKSEKQLKLEQEEISLLRALDRFPEIVQQAAQSFAPNILCTYLFELAQKFNLFYQKHKIIGSENQDFRLTLTAAVGQVIKNGLKLLGIQSPEKM